MAILPPPLPAGGTIAVVAPSRWPPADYLSATQQFFAQHGFKVVVHPQTQERWGRLAGSDAIRAAALMDVMTDPAIDAVICARGGVGAVRLLDQLDYNKLAKTPKPLVGFSDITALLQAITRHSGFMTFHGPMGWNLAQSTNDPRTSTDLLAMLTRPAEAMRRSFDKLEILRAGTATGQIWGGNLHVLSYLSNTAYDWPDDEEIILVIEDVEEPLYKIDMRLRHLAMSGRLKSVRAVIVGEMLAITDGEDNADQQPYGPSLGDILYETLPSNIPICVNFPCGHGNYLTSLPIGMKVKLEMAGSKITFTPSS